MKLKVSHLFHWLYASVMLMPIFAIGFKCLYTIFNPNAKDSYSDSFGYYEQVETQLPSIYENNTLLPNNVYYFDDVFPYDTFRTDTELKFKLLSGYFELDTGVDDTDYGNIEFGAFNNSYYTIIVNPDNDTIVINYCSFDDDYNTELTSVFYSVPGDDLSFTECIFLVLNTTSYIVPNYGGLVSTAEWFETSYVYHEGDGFIDNVFYYSVEQITEQPLFSWASNSFISTPITYVSSLFGVPNDSPILTLLSYWLDISIIWLTFDVLMYLPLLIHRYLDKGVIE